MAGLCLQHGDDRVIQTGLGSLLQLLQAGKLWVLTQSPCTLVPFLCNEDDKGIIDSEELLRTIWFLSSFALSEWLITKASSRIINVITSLSQLFNVPQYHLETLQIP